MKVVRIGRLITKHPVTLEFDKSNTSWDMLVLKNGPLSEISIYQASCIFFAKSSNPKSGTYLLRIGASVETQGGCPERTACPFEEEVLASLLPWGSVSTVLRADAWGSKAPAGRDAHRTRGGSRLPLIWLLHLHHHRRGADTSRPFNKGAPCIWPPCQGCCTAPIIPPRAQTGLLS